MAIGNCTGNKALRGGPAIIHIVSPTFTRRDIRAIISDFDPRNVIAQEADGLGFNVADRNSFVSFPLPDSCDLSVHDLTGVCDATVSFRLSNGKAYAMREAWFQSEDLGFTSDQGDFEIRFASMFEMEEVLSC